MNDTASRGVGAPGAKTSDAARRTVDGSDVTTGVDERPASREQTALGANADDERTFATALGLTPPVLEREKRSFGLRRKQNRPDATGRPLVTAGTAATAAQASVVTNPSDQRARVDETVQSPEPPTASQPIITTDAQPQRQTPAAAVGVTPVAVLPEKVSWIQKRRMRARRVRRTIRHIDPWSVFKISILLYACLYVATMAAGVLLWNAAVGSGLIDRFEGFMEGLGFETWELVGEEIFRGASIIGLVLVAAGAALNVVMAILFNLISDLTGGVRVTVIEEDLGRRARQ